MSLQQLPALNASLNGLCAVLLVAGLVCIKQKRPEAHKRIMLAAVCVSAVFLASYLTYHFSVRVVTRFPGQGWSRPVYFTILISHSLLAVCVLPMVLITVARALKGNLERHRALARWTWPIWMYVSVTGVIVYLMLYQWFVPAQP